MAPDAKARRSVAAELASLAALVALPLAGLAAYLLHEAAQRELTHSTQAVRRLADTAADRAKSRIHELQVALEKLAQRPRIRAMDSQCDPSLADMQQLYPRVTNIITVDLQGRILCGAIPPPPGVDLRVADEALQKAMLADPRFRLSQPLVGRISKRWTVTAVQPVFSELPDGKRLAGTVAMAIDLTRWIELADIEALPAGGVVAIVTGDAIVIARSLDPEGWVGTVRDGPIHHKVLAMTQGTLRAVGADGVDRLWGFEPVPGTGWYAIAGLPADLVYATVRETNLKLAGLMLFVLLAALAIALLAMNRLLAPLNAIAAAVRKRAAGGVDVRLPETGPREIADLAGELNRMIDAGRRMLRERTRSDDDLHRFRAAMDISGDAVLLIDRASLRYVDVNQTFCDLVGYSREEILDMTPMDLFSADRATLERDYDAIIADNSALASKVEGWYRRKDGSRVPIETRRRALRTNEGWIIVGTARDISERRESEARIARLNRMHAVLSGINAAIVRIRDREELFDEAVRIAVEHGGMQSAWMGVVDLAANEISVVAWRGCDEGFVRSLRGRTSMRVDTGEQGGIVARAANGRTAVVSNDVATDMRVTLRAELAAIDVRSLAVLPIVVDGETEAVLTLHASEAGVFDEQEMKLLLELSGDIAYALEHIANREKVDYLAYYDELTGLANRRLFVERVGQQLHAAGQDGGKLALLVGDIERLRFINDSFGRQAGDAVLKALAVRLAAGVDRGELARLSADHFAIVLQGVKGKSAVMRRVARLWQECFGAPFEVHGTELRIAGRAGIAMFPVDGTDPDTLIRSAEAALRRAKQSGERHVFHAAEMTERTAQKLTLENRLRQGLEREEFVLHYQPKVDVETRRIVGVEALIRWQDPELGLVPPGRFIPLMEETGMILEAGDWALRRAVQDHKRWIDMDLPAPRVAVNVSAVQLRKRDYVATLETALRLGSRVPGVDLEITESLVMDDIQGNIDKLKEVRNLGVGIAIDDFGTGYSSLGYLARLPVQALKIDRSFIITMLAKPETMTLVSTIISLAHSLKLKVVAEGVDSEEQAKMLRLLRCDEMQGFLFSQPLPFDDLTDLLRKQ